VYSPQKEPVVMEVIYRQPDGTLVRSLAHYSYRCGPVGEWRIGDTPLDKIDGEILRKGPFDPSQKPKST
jgi:hypothetical protein